MRNSILSLALITSVLTPAIAMADTPRVSDDRYLAVTGTGSVKVIPDIIRVNMSVSSRAVEQQEAASSVREQTAKLREQILEAGAEEKDLQTSHMTLRAIYRHTENGVRVDPPQITGYEAQSGYEITLRDPQIAAAVIDSAIESGVTNINGPYFDVSDPRALAREAKTEAMKDAKETAQALAEAGGFQISGVVRVTEQGGGMPQPYMARAMMNGGAGMMEMSASAPIDQGTEEVTADISVIYEIAPSDFD